MADDNEEVDEADLRRVEDWLRKSELHKKLRDATGAFLTEFATFEAWYIVALIESFTRDAPFVELMADLLDMSDKLTLIDRLAKVHKLTPDLIVDVKDVLKEARKLSEERNEVAHGAAVLRPVGVSGTEGRELLAVVQRAKGKTGEPPVDFKDQAAMEAWYRSNTHSAEEIIAYTDRTISLIRKTRSLALRVGLFKSGQWKGSGPI
jgi:hypothetical protein